MANIPSGRKGKIGPKQFDFQPVSQTLQETDGNGLSLPYPKPMADLNPEVDRTTQFHVDYLKEQFRDVARPNLFKVQIIPPRPLLTDWNNETNGLMALAKKTIIPSITIKEYTYERCGFKLHIPTNQVEFEDVSITFVNDVDFNLRTMFNRWQKFTLYNYETGYGSIPLLALQGKVIIYQYDGSLNPVYAVALTNCWPTSISTIDLSQDSENQAEEFTVNFKYTMQEIYSPKNDWGYGD